MKTDKERERIVFGSSIDWDAKASGGVVRFDTGFHAPGEPISAEDARTLIELGYVDPDDRQNRSPTAEELVSFAESNRGVRLIGYVVHPDRPDARISFTGFAVLHANDLFEAKVRDKFDPDEDFASDGYDLRMWWD